MSEQGNERVVRAEFLDPVPEGIQRELTAGAWLMAEDDTEGQGYKFGLAQTEEDVQGHSYKFGLAQTDEGDDVYGLTSKLRGLGQTEEDVEGQVYRVRIPAQGTDGDTAGHGVGFGLQETDDDSQDAVKIRFVPPDTP